MKKIILFLFGLFLSILSYSQNSQEVIILNDYNSISTTIGRELEYASKLYTSAAVLYVMGSGAILTSYYLNYDNINNSINNPNNIIDNSKQTKDILYAVGGGLIIIGAFCQISGGIHLKTAGVIIDFKTSKDGIGVRIKIR